MSKQGSEPSAEAVRVRAVRLVCEDGWSTADAAKAVGRSQRSVQLWCQKSEQGRKPERLRTKTAPGATPKLNAAQRKKLVGLLKRGSVAAGFASQLWTGPMAGQLIQREFGVTYHVRFLPTLLRGLGFTPQRPKARPSERKEELIEHWIKHRWPAIKKSEALRSVALFSR